MKNRLKTLGLVLALAGMVFVIAGVQVLRVNTSLMPGPLRPGGGLSVGERAGGRHTRGPGPGHRTSRRMIGVQNLKMVFLKLNCLKKKKLNQEMFYRLH